MNDEILDMFNQDLKKKIQTLRTLQGMGEPRPEWLKTSREILLMQVRNTMGNRDVPTLRRGVSTKWDFAPACLSGRQVWQFLDVFLPSKTVYYVVRPVAVVCLIIGLVTGGWVTTVSASYNSLPGDALYQVKLATENVQTTLASKPKETKLRAEFASRRAEEVKKIVKSNIPKKEKKAKVAEAVKHLQNDLEQVKGNLEGMKKPTSASQTTSITQAVEVAKAVEQKTAEIQKSLDQTSVQLKTEAALAGVAPVEEVKQAAASAVETGVKAVEVMVEKNQQDKTAMPQAEVKQAVDNKIKGLEEKMGQVDVQLSQVASSTPSATKQEKQDTATLLAPVKETAEVAKDSINKAREELDKDNLGAALDKVKEGTILTQAAEIKTEAVKILTAPAAEVPPAGGAATSTLPILSPLKEEPKISSSTPAASNTLKTAAPAVTPAAATSTK